MQWPFLNRHDEQTQFEKVINGSIQKSAHFFHCEVPPASGMTAFLKYSKDKYCGSYYCFYIDGSLKVPNSLVSQFLTELFKTYPDELVSFKHYFLEKYPNDIRGKLGSFLNLVPHIGSFIKDYLKESAEYDNLSQLQSLGYPSLVAEMICPYLNVVSSKKPIVMFIDNAQDLDSWSIDIIKSGIGQDAKGLNYFMAFVKRRQEEYSLVEDVLWKIRSLGIVITDVNFGPPGQKLIKELCNHKGLEVNESGILQIAEKSNGNIYKVLTYIHNTEHTQESDETVTNIQIEILGLLDIASQPLRKSDIFSILANSRHIFISDFEEMELALAALIVRNYIHPTELPDGEFIYHLQAKANPYINSFLSNESTKLIRARNLYEYFTAAGEEDTRHSKPEKSLLLYRLSQLVDSASTSRIGQTILSISLKMGSVESATRYIDKATLHSQSDSVYDYFVKVSFYISVRQYQQALKMLLDTPKYEWKNIRIFRVLLAISYNRCRHHTEAENLIRQLISTSKYGAELCILLSYYIAGYMHENNVSAARTVYSVYNGKLKSADNYGYFLRNASTAFNTGQTVEILTKALSVFEKTTDRFGYYSTLCNLGKAKCRLGNLKEAENDLSIAYEKLKLFGFHHLHVVLNNLGICKLLQNDISEAKSFLDRALIFSSNAMPRIYCNINIALLYLYDSEFESALSIMKQIELEVKQFSFDRVKQKFYIHYALISFAANAGRKDIEDILTISERHPDRMNSDSTAQRIRYIRSKVTKGEIYSKDDFSIIADFCYLEYWYQNPLELLPANLLPR